MRCKWKLQRAFTTNYKLLACGLAQSLQSFQSFQVSRHTVYPQSWATQRIFRVFMSFEPMESDRTIPSTWIKVRTLRPGDLSGDICVLEEMDGDQFMFYFISHDTL